MGDPAQIKDLEVVFANIVVTILTLAGIGFFIMLLVGGFSWMTGGGDPRKIEAARNTLTYAVAGLIVVALAFLILRTIAEITGVQSILFFRIFQTSTPGP
ncbi:hypothetical protein A3D00_05480 [Candidatus Woesebacteria bacterium RIFCSPHIGHO2_02_FULL_38_9]|uniref:Uncharacterized protein n=1 Tax=Candidatus Woesebacteria bacterium RIFCSPHIGHO2_01_FULL_39_28 TaxID=1802496 RepID=A0A1F7YL77_9BACT|nr:MAG: hypothetical protein A2627_00625 [Candidatus Woesebacteria bacterium RIFCSPHIGHO2_01_FULL_39_28]OGM33320.1 MAG: hypothetical protein A3D00_05480 [Candidatus Woesebacteria bacterium RIFCSPHIGHO2_02_FULL_38_9]OGM56684.1 MAG: hypothetical protein A3A50_04995 [Candidatus Woesebacteria bacterium RIFCSPLOWO2_01_FULL_38_20]